MVGEDVGGIKEVQGSFGKGEGERQYLRVPGSPKTPLP